MPDDLPSTLSIKILSPRDLAMRHGNPSTIPITDLPQHVIKLLAFESIAPHRINICDMNEIKLKALIFI
ncbi:hypothetical protein ACN4EK_21960 [Pantanalinema rosaneae CENA516]|uniref:hypothetical protein n=1 Tax=Pantanalinema rosaneae TaxID=1620701 RepID=UPI003D6E7E71